MKFFGALLIGLVVASIGFAEESANVPTKESTKETGKENESRDPATELTSQVHFPVERYTLDNGLTVLLQPDNSVPTIAFHTWIRVGSKNEEVGYTGMAHLFEHLSFRGTPRYSSKEYERLLQMNGALNNAATSHDYTDHFVILPSSKLELVLDLESDRLVNLQLDQATLDAEREVVKEERRERVDNNPRGVISEAIFATVFKVHPYRWPLIGYMKDIDAITLKKAQEFHQTYYSPNNAVMVVAGDFEPAAAKRLIAKYYGKIPAQPLPKREISPEPAQKSQREFTLNRKFQNNLWALAFPMSKAGQADNYALELIANILGRGTSSRLHKALVYQSQLATSVMAATYGLQDPGIFEIMVNLKSGANPQKLQDIVYNHVWKIRNALVDDKELVKAKNQVMHDFVDSLKTAQGKAQALGYNEVVLGDYRTLFSDLDKYNAVTKEQIKEVANRYLNQAQRNQVRLQAQTAARPLVSEAKAPASQPAPAKEN